MRILVTGCAGHLGSRFATWLLENVPGVKITGVDNLSFGFRENVPAGVDFIQADLLDYADAPLSFDYVFHFAAFACEGLSPFVRSCSLENTALATTRLITAVLRGGGCKRFVFTSSMATYGRGVPPFDESQACNPIDPYGLGKLYSERDLAIAWEQHGLPFVVIRPHNVYGPGQNLWARYRNVLGLWMRAALEKRPILIYGDGLQERAFSFIDDCLPCFWAAATRYEAKGQIINLGGENPIAIRDAAQIVSEITGWHDARHAESRHEVKRAFCTVEKSQRLLGYVERTSLREGIAAMWRWAQDAWERYPERKDIQPRVEIELPAGLYSYWRGSNTTGNDSQSQICLRNASDSGPPSLMWTSPLSTPRHST